MAGCGTGDNKVTDKAVHDTAESAVPAISDTVAVNVKMAAEGEFLLSVLSNGKAVSAQASDIYFPYSGRIMEVFVRNGQRVTKGTPLARLDASRQEASARRSAAEIDKARLALADVIISQGYDPERPASVPDTVMRLARIRSGMTAAELSLAENRHEIAESVVRAPFAGVVANLDAEPHSITTLSTPFCRIINDGMMEVEFPIIESELSAVKVGSHIDVTPYSVPQTYRATVTEINPMVDKNGQITVRARVSGTGLLDGMNVAVTARHSAGKALAVPKSAVVTRNNRQVVFTVSNNSAEWNYVTTGAENGDSIVIADGIAEGSLVVVDGNASLVNHQPVKILDR